MLIHIRGWPNWNINSTLAVAITALKEIIQLILCRCTL